MPRNTHPDTNIRQDLTNASAKLKEIGEPHLAAAVDKVLGPNGWRLVRGPEEVGAGSKLPVRMPETDRDAIKKAAEEAGDNLTGIVEEGLQAFLDGNFPQRRQRAAVGTVAHVRMVNLNVRPNAKLLARAQERCDALYEEGTRPKVTVSWIASVALQQRYGVGEYGTADDQAQ
ncbi:hypothetical protein [Streptomyces sp. NPDC006551]|uniref:hypothetical protein n=1 Tax=Streptomyces sp. NPDC006551 TaxID=3157178 RepID=UPI0033A175C7